MHYWEESRKVCVHDASGNSGSSLEEALEAVRDVIKMFNLPLVAESSLSLSLYERKQLDQLLEKASSRGTIQFSQVEKLLDALRQEQGILHQGTVVILGPIKFAEKRAYYGISGDSGIALVTVNSPFVNAIKHEFGHMIGLDHALDHHPGCVMQRECDVSTFCSDCHEDIRKIWHL